MFIETDRLYMIPLTAYELKLWVENIPVLEQELDISYHAEPMEGIFKNIVKRQLEVTEKDESNYLYHSFWFIAIQSYYTINKQRFPAKP